jgi:hypothetical protein
MNISSFDHGMPLHGHYFFQFDKDHAWKPVSAAGLQEMLESRHPPLYRTVLGMPAPYEDGKVSCYFGPLYWDIDVSAEQGGVSVAICQVNQLLDKLSAFGLDLDQVRIFATGSKGFHLEVPHEVIAPKLTPCPDLPKIYWEMVHFPEIYVDGIDPRVYSARRGRMWRVPNRPRENGKFKVPVSVEQVRSMSAADYETLTSTPQPWPRLQPPTYTPGLAVLFAQAGDKVTKRAKVQAKASKQAELLRARFNGKLPPSLVGLLQGKFSPLGGWNQICVQIALAAHATGLSEQDLIEQAGPLLDGHRGDGNRYRTRQARVDELKHQFTYVAEAGYQFSVGGLKSIFPRGVNTSDLRGLA